MTPPAALEYPPMPTPLPVPADAPVLLYGGTFDPPHRGHVVLADEARRIAMPGGWLLYVPAGRNPLKNTAPVATGEQRVEMLRLATRDLARVSIWTVEIERAEAGEPSYWIDTLREARRLHAGPLRFLIGADQATGFHRWRAFREILDLAEPVVMPRDPITSPDALAAALRETRAWDEPSVAGWRTWFVPMLALNISATAIRRGNAEGGLDPVVARYADELGLYQSRPPG